MIENRTKADPRVPRTTKEDRRYEAAIIHESRQGEGEVQPNYRLFQKAKF